MDDTFRRHTIQEAYDSCGIEQVAVAEPRAVHVGFGRPEAREQAAAQEAVDSGEENYLAHRPKHS